MEWLVESRTDDPCHDTEYCTATTIGDRKDFDRIINIEGCEVHVKYRVDKCFSPEYSSSFVIFKDIEIKYKNSMACNNLIPLFAVGQEEQYNDALNAFFKLVLDQIEEDYMNSSYPTGSKAVVEYSPSMCFKWCVTLEDDAEFGELYSLSRVKCGASCCKRVTKYVRGYGNVWIKGPTDVVGEPVCTYDPVPGSCIKEGFSPDICNLSCAGL